MKKLHMSSRVPHTACQQEPAAPELLAVLRRAAGPSLQQHGGGRHVGGDHISPWHTVILPLLPHMEEGQENTPDNKTPVPDCHAVNSFPAKSQQSLA